MSTFGYYQYQQEQPLVVDTNRFGYGQDDPRRSKTPSSLTNHPRLSPGPLPSPSNSRGNSQPAPDQPDQMIWDNVDGSQSNSPNSIPTPDVDNFEEVVMLDRDAIFYHHSQNAAMGSTQTAQESIPALDSNMYFSDQTLTEVLNASMAEQARQYQGQFALQNHPSQGMPVTQPYNQIYSQQYTAQPTHRDPWTSQRPQQSPDVPRSGAVVFDPASDHVDYSMWVNSDVNNWTNNNTDPNYLVSPNEPLAPPHDNYYNFPTPTPAQYQNVHQGHRQLEMRVTVPSPPPPMGHHNTFVNYNQSSNFMAEDFSPDSQFPSSPDTSALGSSIGQLSHSHSPIYQAMSPQASLPSPGGSGVFSNYQHSDPGMMVESYNSDQYDVKPTFVSSDASNMTAVQDPTPRAMTEAPFASPTPRVIPEMTFDASPEPESSRAQAAGKGSGRPGGRALGTHLEPKVAKAAHDMRKITACWHCVLQRDKCGPGDICERCMKRSQRPNADCGLGCSRVKLIELAQYFLPTLVTQMHEDSNLTHFVTQHIRQWGNQEITIYMTCGQDSMPRIPVKVYEFVPNGNELLVQIQYKTDPKTFKRVQVKKQSPALGMVHINQNEEKKYDKYITDIVDNHLDAFGELCWMEDDNDFQQKLFHLMTRVKPKSDDEGKLLKEVFRLIVCTFIMSHTLTIAEETKHSTLSKMHSYQGPASYVQNFTSPRMTNRQLKYFFSRLQRSIMSNVLNKLQQIFKSSKGCDKWLAAFVAVLGMAMAHEDQQKTIHLVMETRAATEGRDARDMQARADIACREIDSRMGFIAQIFRWKYNRKCNPLRDADHDWDREVGFGDETSVLFVRQVAQLVKENIDYLQNRNQVSISSANQEKYTSRLVGQFLLSFWYPS